MNNIICPFCQTVIENLRNDMVICNKCGTPHHKDCWNENGKCTVYGCDSVECHGMFDAVDNNKNIISQNQVPIPQSYNYNNNYNNNSNSNYMFIKSKIPDATELETATLNSIITKMSKETAESYLSVYSEQRISIEKAVKIYEISNPIVCVLTLISILFLIGSIVSGRSISYFLIIPIGFGVLYLSGYHKKKELNYKEKQNIKIAYQLSLYYS